MPVNSRGQRTKTTKKKQAKKPAKKVGKPTKGKAKAKLVTDPKTGKKVKRSYGQAGKAKDGKARVQPGTAKGHAYCARSSGIKECANPPCANDLSRKRWKCKGKKSMK